MRVYTIHYVFLSHWLKFHIHKHILAFQVQTAHLTHKERNKTSRTCCLELHLYQL